MVVIYSVQLATEIFEASLWHVCYVPESSLQVNATSLARHLFPWANLQEGGTSGAEAMAFLRLLLHGRKFQFATLYAGRSSRSGSDQF